MNPLKSMNNHNTDFRKYTKDLKFKSELYFPFSIRLNKCGIYRVISLVRKLIK